MLVNKAVSIEVCFGLQIGNWGQAHMSASSKSIHLGIDNNNIHDVANVTMDLAILF